MKPKLHYFAAFVALNVFSAAVPAFGNAPQGPGGDDANENEEALAHAKLQDNTQAPADLRHR